MRAGKLAARSGVKLKTIRCYERVGLLPAPPRSAKGYREYQPDHLRRLVFLRRSRQLGFSIKEVRELTQLAGEPNRVCGEVTRLARTHLAAVRAKARELASLQRSLERLVRSCTGAVFVTEGILEALAKGHEGTSRLSRRRA